MDNLSKKFISVIDLEKLADLIVDDLVLGSIEKVAKDSANPFDDAAFNMLAPLAKVEAHKAIALLIAKLKAL